MAEYGKARSVAIYSVPLPHGPRRHRLKASRPCVSQRQMRALDQVKNRAHPAYSRVRDLVWGIRCQEAIFVLSTCEPSLPSPILLFGPGRSHSPVPAACSERRRAQRRSEDGPSSGHAKRREASLTAASTPARYAGSGRHTSHHGFALPNSPVNDSSARRNPRRARHWVGADRASRPCIRSILRGSHHDAVIRIGGELRGGGSTLHCGSRAMVSGRITAVSDVIGRSFTGPPNGCAVV
jgi:hypothetical protein